MRELNGLLSSTFVLGTWGGIFWSFDQQKANHSSALRLRLAPKGTPSEGELESSARPGSAWLVSHSHFDGRGEVRQRGSQCGRCLATALLSPYLCCHPETTQLHIHCHPWALDSMLNSEVVRLKSTSVATGHSWFSFLLFSWFLVHKGHADIFPHKCQCDISGWERNGEKKEI